MWYNACMKKNIWFIIIIGGVALVELLAVLFFGGGLKSIASYFYKENSLVKGIILFESKNCQQCSKVDNFIKANNVGQAVDFVRLEVLPDNANHDLLADRAQFCGLDASHIGVPFLWDGARCIVGYVDVIQFFKTKLAPKAIIR